MGVDPAGATYEENVLRQVTKIGSKRERKAPKRFLPDEWNVAGSLIMNDDETKSVAEAV